MLALGLFVLILTGAGALAAQTPPAEPPQAPPGDTVPLPGDTVPPQVEPDPAPADTSIPAAAGDTVPALPGDTIAAAADSIPVDSLPPVVVVAPLHAGDSPGWATGVWDWDRAALMRSTAVTLNDLLALIPGVIPIRSGFWGHPEGISVPGGAGGLTEIYLDGFALDPLNSSTYDLSRLELVNLARVRVERRGGGLRIDLETVAPTEHDPYSLVEAGTGEYGARLFRGTFMTPHFIVGPLALGVERLEGSGLFNAEPANTFAGWIKWTRGVGPATLQLEFRRNTVEWRTPDRQAMKGFRQDWVVRARAPIAAGLTTEAFFGGSAQEDQDASSVTETDGVQGGVRAAYQSPGFWSNITLRAREARTLPGLEADLAAGVRLPGRVQISGRLNHADWRAGRSATNWDLRAGFEPVGGVRPFIEVSGGTHGVQNYWDDSGAILTDRELVRAGAELSWRGASLGAAWNLIKSGDIVDFGLPFDRTASLFPGGSMQAVEVNGSIPLLLPTIRLEGWFHASVEGASSWVYRPGRSWRAALAYRDSPLPSGNLEIDARVELSHRGWIGTPVLLDSAAGPGGGVVMSAVPGLTSLDFNLTIRILDLHAFVRWNNILHRLNQQDLPGRIFPGQRAFYGIKWSFWN